MEGEGQRDGGETQEYQAEYDALAATEPVQEDPHEWLNQPVEQDSQRRRQRDGASTPTEVLAHGNDEDAKPLASSHTDKGDEHGGGHDVPTVVDRGFFCWEINQNVGP